VGGIRKNTSLPPLSPWQWVSHPWHHSHPSHWPEWIHMVMSSTGKMGNVVFDAGGHRPS
jgi:hypothetical protein